ncbi:MAG: hypothetical protein Q7U87_01160 [bacterium]|nr:hypothetical protein [bacterium]
MPLRRYLPYCLLFGGLSLCFAPEAGAAGAADAKALATKAKAALRAAENTNDQTVLKAKLEEARGLIDQIKAADPKYPELGVIENKYRYLGGGLKASQEQTAKAQAEASIDWAKVKQVIADWEALEKLTVDFRQKTERFFPNDQNIAYSSDQTDAVLALAADVARNDQPKILAFLKTFTAKYGQPGEATDHKIIELTPKDPKKGMYDEANKRPDQQPSRCYQELNDRLAWVKENPKLEARKIMSSVSQTMENIDFIMDTERDKRFAGAEAEITRALRFSPGDAEITKYLAGLKANRTKSQADVKMALEAARFPGDMAGFAGPGKIPDLAAATRTYFASAYPREKLLKVSVSGGWVATKHNILGEPIQWGLPVYCASQQNEKDVCRVFKMTVLTGIGLGVAKAPPFTDHWTGDSYRMLIGNLK